MNCRRCLPIFLCLLYASACSDSDDKREYEIQFAARAGDASIGCGSNVDDIGASESSITVQDFRFFIHDVQLIDRNNVATDAIFVEDDKWQNAHVALLDFEDGGAACEFGNPDMNALVRVTAPERDYTGLRFKLGVPFDHNHADPTSASSPLNISSMFWNWNSGYKFVRIDMGVAGEESVYFHLGSTGCTAHDGDHEHVEDDPHSHDHDPDAYDEDFHVHACEHPNRVEIELNGDIETQVIVADLAALLSDADLTQNELAPGCMSDPDDGDCIPYFNSIGLGATEAQTFFRLE